MSTRKDTDVQSQEFWVLETKIKALRFSETSVKSFWNVTSRRLINSYRRFGEDKCRDLQSQEFGVVDKKFKALRFSETSVIP
jgi:hypothetical protein